MLLKKLINIIFSILGKIILGIFIKIIRLYQLCISPFLGSNCRFQPTCSAYAIESFKRFGFLQGFYLSLKRIMKCNPWGSSGYDPVPEVNKK